MWLLLDSDLWMMRKGVFIATQLKSTQLNSTRQREQQLTQFVGRDVINKNTTDLIFWLYAVQLGQLSSVELCRYKHPFTYALLKGVSSKGIEWLTEIFNDTKRARSLCDSWACCHFQLCVNSKKEHIIALL